MARPIFWQIDLRRSQVSGLVITVALPNGVMSGGSPSGPLAIRMALPSSTGPIGQGIDIAKPSIWRAWNAASAVGGAIGEMRISFGSKPARLASMSG